jgi:hypothetical protein
MEPVETRMKVRGVGRDAGHEQFVSVALSERPTDDQLRSLHEYMRGWPGLNDNAAPLAASVKAAINELADDGDQNREARYRQALYIVANSAHQSGDLIAKYAQSGFAK